MVADLSGGNHKSIIAYSFHGGGNQQWITEKQVNGQWTIRSVDPNKYFGVEKTPDNGTQLLGLDKPQFWDIEVLPGSQASRLNVKICQWVNDTCFVVDYPLERLAVGTDFQVCAARGGRNQVWVLEEC
ncbi:hypothetical protein EDB85DRAFT_2039928 [Lactarius pseudohatsudake]|nr:hypothetical protein EDB85DRAFT_2039928 [Lactarius pseudohatsudake]